MRGLIGLFVLVAAFSAGPLAPIPALAMSGHDAGIAQGHVSGAGSTANRHRGHAQVNRPRSGVPVLPFGLVGDAYGGTVPEASSEAPPAAIVVQPAPLSQAADRPPCRETTPEGVVVQRGGGCSHAGQ